jgi:hypothetical protein
MVMALETGSAKAVAQQPPTMMGAMQLSMRPVLAEATVVDLVPHLRTVVSFSLVVTLGAMEEVAQVPLQLRVFPTMPRIPRIPQTLLPHQPGSVEVLVEATVAGSVFLPRLKTLVAR